MAAKKTEYTVAELEKMLNDAKKKEKKPRKWKKLGFTKVVMLIILAMSMRWIELTYRLAQQGKEQVAENLSTAIVTLVLGAFVTVALKRFGEKNSLNKHIYSEKGGFENDEL